MKYPRPIAQDEARKLALIRKETTRSSTTHTITGREKNQQSVKPSLPKVKFSDSPR